MFSKIRGIGFLAIILGLIALFQIGCNRNSGDNPFAVPISGSGPTINNANVSFKLVFPQKDSGTQSANILPAMDEPAVVNFQIKLLNYGNTSNPFFIISKQVPVVNGSASAIFESLPTTTILGQIHIENGKIQGYSDFHGALDLIQGENTVTLAPVGSLMPQDVVAKALNEIISSSTLFLNAPQSLVSELDKIVSALLLDSSVAYDEVINNFNNRNGLPLVEIISPTTDQSFVTGDNISIVASATDLDGVISKIEFFHGSEKIGEAQAIPFSCSWKPLSEGTYTLTAKAFDNNSAVGVASPVFIKVVSKVVPVTYTVTYNGNGHTGGSVPSDTNSYEQNSTVTVRSNAGGLVKTGYTFMGWNTQPDGKGVSYSGGDIFQVLSVNVTLYAIWNQDPTFTVTYDGNGHTGGTIPIDNLLYQENATVTVKENIGSLVKNGYTFAGWNTSLDGSGTNYNPAATFTMGSTNVTLYAKWLPTYNVIYNGNGNTDGSIPVDSLNYQKNEVVFVKDNTGGLAKTGYTFVGWNTAADGSGESFNPGSTFSMGSMNSTLFAQWGKNSTKVSGIINADTTWSLENSPYELTAKVQIANGSTLKIEPGVSISGNGHSIEVFGALKALGNTNSRITFTNTKVVPGSQSSNLLYSIDLDYLEFNSGAIYPPTGNGIYGSFNLRNSVINGVDYIYVWYPKLDCLIEGNIFKNSGGISVGTNDSVKVVIQNNVFMGQRGNCQTRIYAVEVWASYSSSQTLVQNNSFLDTGLVALCLPVGYTGSKVAAANNFWNTSNAITISEMIFDKNDDLGSPGIIEFEPFLTAPHQDTPDPTPYL